MQPINVEESPYSPKTGSSAKSPDFISHRIKSRDCCLNLQSPWLDEPTATSRSRSTVRMTQRGRQQVSSCPGPVRRSTLSLEETEELWHEMVRYTVNLRNRKIKMKTGTK